MKGLNHNSLIHIYVQGEKGGSAGSTCVEGGDACWCAGQGAAASWGPLCAPSGSVLRETHPYPVGESGWQLAQTASCKYGLYTGGVVWGIQVSLGWVVQGIRGKICGYRICSESFGSKQPYQNLFRWIWVRTTLKSPWQDQHKLLFIWKCIPSDILQQWWKSPSGAG